MKQKTKIVFLGTPEFAINTLRALINLRETEPEKFELSLIITQPDRKANRGQALSFSSIKKFSVENNLEGRIRQPEKIKQDQVLIQELKFLEADLFVTCAYGQIISSEILEIPRWGIWNVHASLLPAWRGAAPIPWSIMAGDQETGISIMQTEVGLDTGDILAQEKIRISEQETSETLEKKLSVLGAELLIKAIRLKLEEKISPIKQIEEESTYAKKITSDLAQADFKLQSAEQIERKIRALSKHQKVFFIAKNSLTIKIIQAEVRNTTENLPGQIIKIDSAGVLVRCREQALLIKTIQLPNKKVTDAFAWYNGQRKDLSSYF